MPTFEVQDDTGKTFEIEGDQEPTAEDLSSIFGKTQTVSGSDPYNAIGQGMTRLANTEKGSFNQAFTPPKAVSDLLESILPSAKVDSPEMQQLVQMMGLEPTRATYEAVASRIKGAIGSVLSPGGAVFAVAGAGAPELVGGLTAATMAPTAIEGAKELESGVKQGSASEIAGGLTDLAIGGAGVVGGGLAAIKPAIPDIVSRLTKPAERTPHAIPERSATPISVEEPPSDSGEVGARTPVEEKASVPQEEKEAQAPVAPDVVKNVPPEGIIYDADTHDQAVANVNENLKGKKRPGRGDLFRLYDTEYKRLKLEEAQAPVAPVAETPTPAQVEAGGNETPPEPGEIASMGGARPEELSTEGNPDVYGIAQRVREERAKAGQVDPVQRGKGINAPDSVEHGRELLAAGSNPESTLKAFEETKRFSSDDIALTRAHGENLALIARRAEEHFGTDSPEYRTAKAELSSWDKRSKAINTEWSKGGQAQQGQTDIDTGSFTGLERAYRNSTGKEFTPDQTVAAKKRAKASKDANADETSAKTKLFDHLKRRAKETDPEAAAIKAANQVVIDWAAKSADLERKKQVADAQRALEISKINQDLEAKLKASVDKLATKNAIKQAREELKAANDKAKRDKDATDIQLKAEKKALDAANKAIRDAAVKKARQSAKNENTDLATKAWSKVGEYIENGMDDFDDVRNKAATDLGVSVEKITQALAKDKRAKFLADEAWRKQQISRRVRQEAKLWVEQASASLLSRMLASIPRALFNLKVGLGLHGFVAEGTHAPMLLFQPPYWKAYFRDFGQMYKQVFDPAFYEQQMADLPRRKNWTVANRAGLINEPFQHEEYTIDPIGGAIGKVSPEVAKKFNQFTGSGNRGYAILKILRQDMFDQEWDKLPRTQQIQEVAEAIASGINHVTGITKQPAPRWVHLGAFAPRLMASRAMWLVGDPVKAANTFLHWKDADPHDRYFAVRQIKEKAWVLGTLTSLLAANQGFLSLIGSKQKVNVTNPMDSDFLKFKVGGMNIGYGSPMLNMAKLPAKLALAVAYRGKLGKIVLADETAAKILFDYARTQASPLAGTILDLFFGRDYAERPLPRKLFGAFPGDKDLPKRLRMHGVSKPYTWPEWSSQEFSPIPVEEALKDVWGKGLGMSEEQQKQAMKALLTISLMSATGARLTDDIPKRQFR